MKQKNEELMRISIEEYSKRIGERISNAMKRLGKTIEDVALGSNVSEKTIERYIKGESLKIDSLVRISTALGLQIEDLIQEKNVVIPQEVNVVPKTFGDSLVFSLTFLMAQKLIETVKNESGEYVLSIKCDYYPIFNYFQEKIKYIHMCARYRGNNYDSPYYKLMRDIEIDYAKDFNKHYELKYLNDIKQMAKKE